MVIHATLTESALIPDRVLIWTTRGYVNVGEVTAGDKVISYNAQRGCTEYDTIGSAHTEWEQRGLIGIKHGSIQFLLTPDHPLLIINPYTKELSRPIADDLFMRGTGKYQKILTNKMFEPYSRTQQLDDAEWTARLAVSSSRHRLPPLYADVIHNSIKDITGIEAQAWLTTFFHWNILRPRTNYMKTTLLRSDFVKDMLYHVAPRAGVGTFEGPYKIKANHYRFNPAFSITREGDIQIQKGHWCADRQEGILYNISTRNGNFLAKYTSSTFPIACEYS